MALCNSGSMSLGGSTVGRSVNCELDRSGTACISMGETEVRDLVEVSSGAISMDDFYGASSFPEPVTLGDCDPAWGGFYMGTILTSGASYYLFVAPNATGCACCQWKTSQTSTSGTCSLDDGYANTYPALENSTHPAGNWTATRTIDGFSDWYIPSIDELEVFYNNGGGEGSGDPLPSGEDFAIARDYWSSTENNSRFACSLGFFSGSRGGTLKDSTYRVRAVRRVPI